METLNLNQTSLVPVIFSGLYLVALVLTLLKFLKLKKEEKLKSLVFKFLLFLTGLLLIFISNLIFRLNFMEDMYSSLFGELVVLKLYFFSIILPLLYLEFIGVRGKLSSNIFMILILCAFTFILVLDAFVWILYPQVLVRIFEYIVLAANFIFYILILRSLCKDYFQDSDYRYKINPKSFAILVLGILLLNHIFLYYSVSTKAYYNYVITILLFAFLVLLLLYKILYRRTNIIVNQFKIIDEKLPLLKDDWINPYGNEDSIQKRLIVYVEQNKPYLSPDISIDDLARKLYTNKSYLSKIINVNLNKNFREFLNYYRVREAMNLYISNNSLTIQDLCTKSGFRNNASFTNAFKFQTGSTPGEWCRNTKSRMSDVENFEMDTFL